jgi:homoserine acetyltransferase
VRRAAPIAGNAQNTPHDYLFLETLKEAIWSDPGWNGGEYKSNADVLDGLTRHAHLFGVMGFSSEFWKQEVWRALNFQSKGSIPRRILGALFHGDGSQVLGHLGVFAVAPTYMPQIDRHLGELLAADA